MRKILLLPLLALLFTSYSSPPSEPLTGYVPIMMDRSDLNTSIAFIPAKQLKATGKLYKFANTLFVIEPYKGVHVFDNTNPASPAAKGFIRIPGCLDIAIKDGFLYADNAVDLVTLSIDANSNYAVVDRKMDVFPEMLPPDQMNMPSSYSKTNRPAGLIIVGWKNKNEPQ